MIKIERIYEPSQYPESFRVLVDRLWPRGVSKERAAVDLWLKEIAPSDGLRTWYQHEPAKWNEFKSRYFAELDENSEWVDQLRQVVAEHAEVTFLYSSKERELNNAYALLEYLMKRDD